MKEEELYKERTEQINELSKKYDKINYHLKCVIKLRKEVVDIESEINLSCKSESNEG